MRRGFRIVDPAMVTRAAVENAASIAGMLLTTESLIAEKPDDKGGSPGMPPGGNGWHGLLTLTVKFA